MPLTDQQREAVERIDDSLCVIAGAGTGKTRVLVERYLHAVTHSELEPEDIAAITFTEKAAAEMVTRLRSACQQRARDAATADERQLWLERRDALAAGTIATIHGFCGRLIRQYPVEANVDPQFAIVAEAERSRLLRDAVHDTVVELVEGGDAAALAVARAWRLPTLLELVERAVSRRAELLRSAAVLELTPQEQLDELRRAVEVQAAESIEAMRHDTSREAGFVAAAAGAADDLAETARQVAVEALGMLAEADSLAGRLDGLRSLAGISLRGGRAGNWAGKEQLDQVKAALKILKEAAGECLNSCDVPEADQWSAQIELSRSLTRVSVAASEAFQRAKLERGQIDFEDLLLSARDLLQGSPEVRRRLAERMKMVLVDELQDTDPLQMEVLGLLLGRDEAGRLSPRAGGFFGVGDPQQSIYRFRGADVETFRSVARCFEPDRLVPLSLTFRFHAGLASVTEAVFRPMLGEDFNALTAHRAETPPVSAEVLLVPDAPNLLADDRRRREAARIAHRIRSLIDEGLDPGDVAILMHRQTQSYPYEDALNRLGIPFYVVGGRRFYEQDEVRDAVTALRSLRNPCDDASLAALLRGPLFVISDDALFLLCRAGPLHQSLRSKEVRAALPEHDRAKAERAAAWLTRFGPLASRLPTAELLSRLLFDNTGAEGVADAALGAALLPQFLGQKRYANLRQLVDVARRADRMGESRLESLLEDLERGIEEGVEEAEAPLAEEGKGAVLLMTVHKAKGLEFPCVVLANADAGRTAKRSALHMSPALGLAPSRPDRPVESADSAAYQVAHRQETAEELAEFRRLFYVAATRAQQLLIVSGSQRVGKDSWLDWLGRSLETDLAAEPHGQRVIEPRPGGRIVIDVEPARPITLHPGPSTGPLDKLCHDGTVDEAAAARLRQRRSAKHLSTLVQTRLAPIAADVSRLHLTVTALADYARCPALYRLKHVLGIKNADALGEARYTGDGTGGEGREAIDAALLGTVCHAVLERLDFARPEMIEALAEQAGATLGPTDAAQRLGLAERATRLVWNVFRAEESSALAAEVAAASETLREVPFVLEASGALLSGTIDLLYRRPNGAWRVVDYKSGGVGPGRPEESQRGQMTQLAAYIRVAKEVVEGRVQDACLLFLGSGTIECMSPEASLELIDEAVAGIRAGRFDPADPCPGHCVYCGLCR